MIRRVIVSVITAAFFSPSLLLALPKITIDYVGNGSAELREDTATFGSGAQSCRIDNAAFSETVTGVSWSLKWTKINVINGANPDPTSAQFSANKDYNIVFSTDLRNCAFQVNNCLPQSPNCILGTEECLGAPLEYFLGILPGLEITKQGKGYILKIKAEAVVNSAPNPDPFNPNSTTSCGNSSVFDNNIVEGMQGIHITEAKIKITPLSRDARRKVTRIQIPLAKDYNCADPAKIATSLLETCTLSSKLQGTVTISGKWKAKLVE